MSALVLVLTLIAAPCAWAADEALHDAGSLWTSIESWFQSVLADWLGVDTGNPAPGSTYDRADDAEKPMLPSSPTSVGPGGTNTTDSTADPDPNGG